MNFMAAVTICSDFGTPKIKSVSVSMFPHLLSMKSWEIEWETVSDFIFGGSKITADGDCSHEIQRHLVLGRKAMTTLDSISKSRDSTLPTNVH